MGIDETLADYVAVRERIEQGEASWTDLGRFFTDNVVYIDPAWGRVEGIDALMEFFVESMTGLEDWRFPVDFVATSGDMAVIKWTQVLPGGRADGSAITQSGVSTLRYAGNGRFDYEEDLLNMTQVIEDVGLSNWRPTAEFNIPPPNPNRDWSRPS